MVLPKIDYKYWLTMWYEKLEGAPVYTNKNLKKFIQFDKDIGVCISEINELTKNSNPSKVTVLRVIDLIYSCSGPSGRMFYAKTKGKRSAREDFDLLDEVYCRYLEGVYEAQNGNPDCIKIFNSIRGIGASYASKQAYFWSQHSNYPLIIIDSKIAGALGYKTIDKLNQVLTYKNAIKAFIKKAKKELNTVDPSQMEKSLFAFHDFYFLNDNSNWKRKEISTSNKDYNAAVKLSKVLF